MDINEMADRAYSDAVRLGKITGRSDIDKLGDLKSEYYEAAQALFKGNNSDIDYFKELRKDNSFSFAFKETIKDTYQDELTDCLKVVLTLMRDCKMDIGRHWIYKTNFNEIREDHKKGIPFEEYVKEEEDK